MKLTTRNLVRLEKKLGMNPLSLFTGLGEGQMPSVSDLLTVWQFMLISEDKKYENADEVYEKYDEYISEGGDFVSLMNDVIAGLQESGVIPKNVMLEQ